VRVTLLGHASLLLELDGANVLMDPVFQDPFQDGAVVACPQREVFPDRLPRIDKIVISHAHLDHFDIRSLARLPRDLEVLCPQDPVLPYALGKLGFHNVRMLAADTFVDFGSWQILTTYSNVDVIEVGVVFRDRSGTCWNEVDSVVTPETIEKVRAKMGHVELLFTGYASQNVGFFESMRAGYPLGFTRMNLANVKAIGPTLAVPGSAGYRFAGVLEWTNAFLFPISRDYFLEDLGRVAPEVQAALANPGDVFDVEAGSVVRHEGASSLARMIEDDTHLLAFDATAEVPPLTDPNTQGYPDELVERQVAETLDGLERFVRSAYQSHADPVIEEYRRTGFSYGLGVVFPDGQERWRHFHFDRDEPRIATAAGPLRGAITTHRIAASMLTARARYEKSYLYYRGFSRVSQTFHGTDVSAGGVVREAKEPADLLGYYLATKAPGADRAPFRRMDFLLEKFFRASAPPDAPR
jgi:UDP-MurNAc hydroxylase